MKTEKQKPQHISPSQRTNEKKVVAITAFQAVDLLRMLKTVQGGNTRLSENVASWIIKNSKKLGAVLKIHQPKEDYIVKQYAETTEGKKVIFWDGHEDEVKQGDKVIFGRRAILNDAEDGLVFLDDTSEIVPRPQFYAPYIADPTRREEYLAKKRALNDGKYEVTLEAIPKDRLANVMIPTPEQQGNEKYDLLEYFYEVLVDMPADEDDEVKDLNPLAEAGTMSIVKDQDESEQNQNDGNSSN